MDPEFKPAFKVVNPNKQIRWPFLKKSTLDSPYFRKTLRLLFSGEFYAGLKNFYKTKMVRYKPRPELDNELRAKLMRKIKPEIENLSNALDLDLVTRWSYHKI